MLQRRLCEICRGIVEKLKANHKQTRYCARCAKVKKRENTFDPWTTDERREYMRIYMRNYRLRHPGLSTPYVQRHRTRKRQVLRVAA